MRVRGDIQSRRSAAQTIALLLLVATALLAAAPKSAAAQGPPPPDARIAPSISGTAQEGNTLTGDDGRWRRGPRTFERQWLRCDDMGANCADIPQATGSTYTLTADDVGHTIVFRVTASNNRGSGTAQSAPTATVLPMPPANGSQPTISGLAQEGYVLTASPGSWTPDPATTAYQWQRCDLNGANCTDIAGATTSTYTLGTQDVDSTIRVAVTASNAGGSSTARSQPTPQIAPAQPVGTPGGGHAYRNAVLADDPYHYFRFEDPDSFVLAEEGTSEFGDGDRQSETTIGGGRIGGAIALNGSAAGYAHFLDLGYGPASALTIEFWIRTTSAGVPPQRFVASNRNEARGDGFSMYGDGQGGLSAGEHGGDGSNCNCTVNDGQWHHVVYVQSGATNSTQWYLDGQKTQDVPGYPHQSPVSVGPSGNALLGFDTYDFQGTFGVGMPMEMDEFASYERALTADEVADHWAARDTPLPAPPKLQQAPQISGSERQAETLTAGDGTWTGAPTSYRYQWTRCDLNGTGCDPIDGATDAQYTLREADVGNTVRVLVYATNAGGTTRGRSDATGQIGPKLSGYPAAVLADDPYHLFRFEDDTTTDLAEEGSSTLGDGVRAGGATIGPGRIGSAISIAGGGGSFARFLDMHYGPNWSMTIEMWIKTTGFVHGMDRFAVTNRSEGRGEGFAIYADAGGLIATDDAGTGSFCGCSIYDDTWHHVAYVQSGDTGKAQWFVDGEKTNEVNGYAMTSPHGSGPTGNGYLGFDPYTFQGLYGTGLPMRMDEFAFYKRALSEDEVKAHYAAR